MRAWGKDMRCDAMCCAAPGGLLRSGVRGKLHTEREGRPISLLLDPIGRRRSTSSTPTKSRSERWKGAKMAVFKGPPWGGKKAQATKTGIRLAGRPEQHAQFMPSSSRNWYTVPRIRRHQVADISRPCPAARRAPQIHRSHRPLSVPASDPFPTKSCPRTLARKPPF